MPRPARGGRRSARHAQDGWAILSPVDRRLSALLSDTLVYGLGGVLQRLVSVLLLPVLTRYLAPAEYGVVGVLDVLATGLVAILTLGFGTSLTVTYFDKPVGESRDRAISTAFWILAATSSVALAAALPASGRVATALVGDAAAAPLVQLSLVTSALSVLALPFTLRLQYEQRAGLQAALSLAAALLTAVLALYFVVGLGRGVQGLLEGRLAGQLAGFLLYAASFPSRRLVGRAAFDAGAAAELVRLGLPMVPSFATLFVLQQGNRWFLSLFASMDAVGLYTVGTQLGTLVALAVTAFNTAWTPYFMGFAERRDEAGPALARAVTWYVFVFGTITLLVFGGARAALMILAAPLFEPGFRVAGAAAAAQALIGAYSLFTPPSVFAKEIHFTSLVQAATLVLAIAFNLLLIPPWGLIGAALALVLGPLARVLCLVAWNRRRGTRYLRLPVDRGRVLGFLAAAAPAAVLLTLPRSWPLPVELGVFVATALFALTLLLLFSNAAERSALRRLPTELRRDAR